jgi:response regulator NasT
MFEIPAHSLTGSDGSRASRTVMVVDDDRLVLLTLAHGLRQAGFDVVEADNGDDAILMARTRRPGLALLDIRMQGLSGFDVAQHLKDYERIPFMFISAFADEQTRKQALEFGALACLSKPIDMADLVGRVKRALGVGSASSVPHTEPVGRLVSAAVPAAAKAPPETQWPEDVLAMGLLMQRESLSREQAWSRLQKLAASRGVSAAAVGRELLRDHERSVVGGDDAPQAPAGGGPSA